MVEKKLITDTLSGGTIISLYDAFVGIDKLGFPPDPDNDGYSVFNNKIKDMKGSVIDIYLMHIDTHAAYPAMPGKNNNINSILSSAISNNPEDYSLISSYLDLEKRFNNLGGKSKLVIADKELFRGLNELKDLIDFDHNFRGRMHLNILWRLSGYYDAFSYIQYFTPFNANSRERAEYVNKELIELFGPHK